VPEPKFIPKSDPVAAIVPVSLTAYPDPPTLTVAEVIAPAFPLAGAPQAKLLVFPPNPMSH
jgi:hypothetical protein